MQGGGVRPHVSPAALSTTMPPAAVSAGPTHTL